ncbi:hypothetical protein [Streptomyces sp. NPDC059881]|uniref:hypothetical protein n=1 Tax=Streptomyces sp. NPDC059881 TaxID=3346986 RepID=UPI003649E65F
MESEETMLRCAWSTRGRAAGCRVPHPSSSSGTRTSRRGRSAVVRVLLAAAMLIGIAAVPPAAASGAASAAAVPAPVAHPRIVNASQLAKVRRIIAVPGTAQKVWDKLVATVDEGEGSALDAAFVLAVTGEQRYAAQAFTLFRQAGESCGASRRWRSATPCRSWPPRTTSPTTAGPRRSATRRWRR